MHLNAWKTEIMILTGIHLIATSFFVSLCSASFTSENAPLKYIFISRLKIEKILSQNCLKIIRSLWATVMLVTYYWRRKSLYVGDIFMNLLPKPISLVKSR